MSQQMQDYVSWLYNLFSQLVPYWDILARLQRVLTIKQAGDITRAGLEQGGCETIDENAFRCDSTYVRIASIPVCMPIEAEIETAKGGSGRRILYPLAVGLETRWFYLITCVNELSLKLWGQEVRLDSAVFRRQTSPGELSILLILYIPSTKEDIYLRIFTSPTEIWWEFVSKEDEERMNATGLRPYDVVSAILNSEEARAVLEDGVKGLKNILPNVSRAVVTYLLY